MWRSAATSTVCSVGDIDPGQSVSFAITVMLDENAVSGQILTNRAEASGAATQVVSDTARIIVDGGADLRISQVRQA